MWSCLCFASTPLTLTLNECFYTEVLYVPRALEETLCILCRRSLCVTTATHWFIMFSAALWLQHQAEWKIVPYRLIQPHVSLQEWVFCKKKKEKSAFCNYFQPSFTYCTAQMCFCLFHTVKLSSGSADDILYLTKKNKTNINVFLIIIINVINITFVLCNRHIGLMGVTYVMS